MTPREKAKELVKKHTIFLGDNGALEEYWTDELEAKKHALISVNEAIDQWEYIDIYISNLGGELNTNLKYWYEVKEEIIKL